MSSGMGRFIEHSKNSTVYLLALVLIVSSAFEIYAVYIADYHDEWGFIDEIYSAVIKILMAEFILFDPKKNVMRAMGFYAMSIGLSRIIASLSILIQPSAFSLATGIITLALGANILISSYNYLNDTTRGRLGILVGTGLLALLQTVMLMLSYQAYRATGIVNTDELISSVVLLVQYIVLLLIMDTSEIRYGTLMEKTNTRIESLRVTDMIEGHFKLERDDASVLRHMFEDRSSWAPVNDNGPAECERSITLIDGRIQSCMLLQKWNDSDKIHFTVSNSEGGSVIAANRFSVSQVYSDTDDDDTMSYLRLFDDDRMIAQFSIKEKEEPKKKRRDDHEED